MYFEELFNEDELEGSDPDFEEDTFKEELVKYLR